MLWVHMTYMCVQMHTYIDRLTCTYETRTRISVGLEHEYISYMSSYLHKPNYSDSYTKTYRQAILKICTRTHTQACVL